MARVLKSFLILQSALIMDSKSALIVDPECALIMDSKKYKRSLMKKLLNQLKLFNQLNEFLFLFKFSKYFSLMILEGNIFFLYSNYFLKFFDDDDGIFEVIYFIGFLV